jgi:ribonucleoside-diphosphate reductase alpha chain
VTLLTELTPMAEEILQARYYDRDADGNYLEDWRGLAMRVATSIASEEAKYGIDPQRHAEDFFDAIYNLDFLPNSPALMNAGSVGGLKLLSACFVQIPDDSIDSIMQHAWHSAKLFQAGAGVGYNFSNLRAEGEMVKSSMRPSSGSVSFMKHIFNSIGDVVKQGGRRRAAMMGLLNDDHPEIEKFIGFKNEEDSLENFNISILSSDAFMRAIETGGAWDLHNRADGSVARTVSASDLFTKMIGNNHRMAEPGMIFVDAINKHNPLRDYLGDITCVNPCGEATLYNYENCCLGSINLVNHVSNGEIDWSRLERTIRIGVRFLDDVVDANVHVAPEFSRASLSTRRIGLGVTGFADVLVMLGSVYGSESSYRIAEDIATFINSIAVNESERIAEQKAPYPLWEHSQHKEMGLKLRNVSLLAIAPEGSRSLISNTSASIEPNFGREITRTTKGIGAGTWVHPLANDKNFVTTYEVPFASHIKMQAVWQNAMNMNMVGQSISKTNNAPTNISVDDLGEAYLEAWRLGCKGLTTYRDKSRDAVYYEKREGEERDEHGRMTEPSGIISAEEYEALACTIGGGCDGMEKVPADLVKVEV